MLSLPLSCAKGWSCMVEGADGQKHAELASAKPWPAQLQTNGMTAGGLLAAAAALRGSASMLSGHM